MSKTTTISEDVQNIIEEIIVKHKLNPNSKITYEESSDGRGYMSNTIAVDISSKERTVHLFLKYSLNVESKVIPLHKLYATERHFFSVIYPEYLKFAQDRGVDDALENIPKCFGTSERNVVALENLRMKSFEMFDTKIPMNKNHISAALKPMAKFHAVSFAFRDQNRERYGAITANLEPFFDESGKMLEKSQFVIYRRFLQLLDPVEDKIILDYGENVCVNLLKYFKETVKLKNENCILTKGDCWSNNLMFRYESENKENPIDVALLDWQTTSIESVVRDLSHFFYTSAAKEDLRELKYYLKVYHDVLSKYMKKLGSDPEKIFPFSALEEEWTQHSIFGYGLAIMFLHIMIAPKQDKIDVETLHTAGSKTLYRTTNLPDEYVKRLKDLTKFCIENKFV